jgi:hypothetical protein
VETAYNNPEILQRNLSAHPAHRRCVLVGHPELRAEVLALGKTSLYGPYNPTLFLDIQSFQSNDLLETIRASAPTTLQTLQYISGQYNKHESRETQQSIVRLWGSNANRES